MGDRISTPKDMKRSIFRGIRTALLNSGSATKVELSEQLGISFPTISKFVGVMEKAGEVAAVGLDDSSGGRRARRYAYNPDYRLGITMFLEKKETPYAICNALGEVKESGSCSGVLQEGTDTLTKQLESLMELHPGIRAISFGVPGAVKDGRIIHIPGYEKFQDFDLKGFFQAKFRLPVAVENDMNAAVLGYCERMRVSNSESLVYLCFGQNGPGAGLWLNGSVVRGSTSFSGEVSFVPLYDGGNFQQAISNEEGAAVKMNNSSAIDAVSRLIASYAAMVNPKAIIFCRDEVSEELLDAIASRSAAYIPREHLPVLAASDWREDYLNGLRTLGMNLILDDHED